MCFKITLYMNNCSNNTHHVSGRALQVTTDEVTTDASVVRVGVHLDTCQLNLVPEGAVGTRHREDGPLVGATGRLAHVELLAAVGVSRESGSALCEVVAQRTILCSVST